MFYYAGLLIFFAFIIAESLVRSAEPLLWLEFIIFWLIVLLFLAGAVSFSYPAAYIFFHRLRFLYAQHIRHANVYSGQIDRIEKASSLVTKNNNNLLGSCRAHIIFTDSSGLSHSIISNEFLYFKEEKMRQDTLANNDISLIVLEWESQGKTVYTVDLSPLHGIRFMYQRINPWRLGSRLG